MAFINKSAKEIQVKVVYLRSRQVRQNYQPALRE